MACPQVNEEDVKRLLEEAFSYSRNDIIYIKSLGSCQDANFKVKVRDQVCDKKFVLKFSNLKSTFEELKFQNELIIHSTAMQVEIINGTKDHLSLPKPIEITNLDCRVVVENVRDKYIAKYRRRLPSETENDGKAKAEKEEGGDEVYYVRLFSFVEGSLMSDANHLSPYSLHQYGQFVAYFCDLTSHFREYHGHYAEIPPSDWAIETALIHIKKYAATLSEVGQAAMFDSTIYKLLKVNYGHVLDVNSLFGSTGSAAVSLKEPLLALADAMSRRISDLSGHGGSGRPFRRAVLHGDLALYNLVTAASQGQVDTGSPAVEVSGVIDFGDACESWVVGELVVAIASVHGKGAQQNKDQADSLMQAASMVAGFSQYCSRSGCPPLTEEEVAAIWPMLLLRAVLEMFVLAHQQQELQNSSDGSGGSTLKYCEDGLKGIKRAFAAVLRVAPYLAQTHLLSAATTTTTTSHDDVDGGAPFEDNCTNNNTDCSSSLYPISRSISAIIADPSSSSSSSSSAVVSPVPVRAVEIRPSTMTTPVSSKDHLSYFPERKSLDFESLFLLHYLLQYRCVGPAVDVQILSPVFEKHDGSGVGFGRRVVQAQCYGSQHQDGVSLVSKLLFSAPAEDTDRNDFIIASDNHVTVELNAPWAFEAASVHLIDPTAWIGSDRDMATRAELFHERCVLLRSSPESCEPDLLISADIEGPEGEGEESVVRFTLPVRDLHACGSRPRNPKGVVFASVEFAVASSKKPPALFVQLIPKGVDLTCSTGSYPVSFLPPRYSPAVYRATYGKLCPDPSALLPVLLHSYLTGDFSQRKGVS